MNPVEIEPDIRRLDMMGLETAAPEVRPTPDGKDIIPISREWTPTAPKPGCHRVSFADYQAAPGVSQSMLKVLSQSPAHLQAYLAGPRKETKATTFGTLVHAVLFEPLVSVPFVVKPEGHKGNTTAGKQWLALNRPQMGEPIISHAEHVALGGIAASARAHHYGSGILGAPGISEVSVFAELIPGVLSKGRLDRIVRADDGRIYIADVKTTEDASRDAFRKNIENYEYHRQAAYYLDLLRAVGVTVEDFLWVAVEKTPPYAVGVYRLGAADMEAGRRLYRRELATYAECVRKNKWPAYAQGIVTLELKPWAKGKELV